MVERETLSGYMCAVCQEKRTAKKGATITRLPSNLVINLMYASPLERVVPYEAAAEPQLACTWVVPRRSRVGSTCLVGVDPVWVPLPCRRFDWDYSTMTRSKLTSRFEVPLVLDMRPFVAGGSCASVVPPTDETDKQQAERLVRAAACARWGPLWCVSVTILRLG